MSDEEELIEDAQRSRAETAKLRDGEEPRDDDVPGGDTESVATDDE